MLFRVLSPDGNKITVQHEDARYYLDPSRHYSDKNPADKLLIDLFPGHFAPDNVERATAAPGEKRSPGRPRKAAQS